MSNNKPRPQHQHNQPKPVAETIKEETVKTQEKPAEETAAKEAPVEKEVTEKEAPAEPKEEAAAPEEKPVVSEQAAPVVMERFTDPVPTFDEFHLPSSVSLSATVITQALQVYVEEMSRKITIDHEVGAAHQNNLHRTLLGVIRSGDQDFTPLMDMTCKVFHEHKNGCFSATNVFRFIHHMRPSVTDVTSFKLLVNMFMLMANPNQRNRDASKKHLNIEVTLSHPLINEQQRQRVMAYFGV